MTVDGDEENARKEVEVDKEEDEEEEEERRRFLQSIREWLKNVRTSLDMWGLQHSQKQNNCLINPIDTVVSCQFSRDLQIADAG